MTVTHYPTGSGGATARTPRHTLIPRVIPASGGAWRDDKGYRARVELFYEDDKADRAWVLTLTPEEARETAARLLSCAQRAEEAKARLDGACQ